MVKRILISVLLVVILGFTVVLLAFNGFDSWDKSSHVKLVTPDEIHIPEKMKIDNFGLFFYDSNLNRVRTTEKNVPFDPEKPMIIFSHGMSLGFGVDNPEEFENPKGWLDAGYNVGIFMWSQISDDDPFVSEKKVWGGVNNRFAYHDEKGKTVMESEDVTNYSMAEIFVAYYYDFMSKQNFVGREIRFEGLSLGTQVTLASCSYLLALNKAGIIGKEFFPDRITLLDTFLTNIILHDVPVPWLNSSVGKDGTVALALNVLKELSAKGIAVEYVESSAVSATTSMGKGEKGNFVKFMAEMAVLQYRSDWIPALSMDKKHIVGRNWYNLMIEHPAPLDNALGEGQFGISPNVPTSYIYARMGDKYFMNENHTLDPSDDVQFSKIEKPTPTVAGFVFEDKNGNGNYDDRLLSRINGVTVELYSKTSGALIGSAITEESGAYLIPIEPIYLTSDVNEFYIKVNFAENYTVTPKKGTSDFLMMGNDIGSDAKSDVFKFNNYGDLKIINVGLIEK